VERAFRSLKTVDLQVRPIFHWNAGRVRAHVFLCMLAYYQLVAGFLRGLNLSASRMRTESGDLHSQIG